MKTAQLKKLIPPTLKYWLKKTRNAVLSLMYRGEGRYCPICDKSSRKFAKQGSFVNARCVHCGAHERHRIIWLYLNRKTDLFNGRAKKMLNIGVEQSFEKLLRLRLGAGYLTADLYDPRAMIKLDVTNIHYPDASFDVIYCSHVLAYVPNDKQAMKELFRVLKPHGWAILADPVSYSKTTDVPFIDKASSHFQTYDPEDSLHHYGPDYEDRLRAAGFKTSVIHPSDFLNAEERECMGITTMADEIFYCTKE